MGELLAGTPVQVAIPSGRPHRQDDRRHDADDDEDVADAEHVREGQPRRHREDVGQRPERRVARRTCCWSTSSGRSCRGRPGRIAPPACSRRWPRSRRGCSRRPARRSPCPGWSDWQRPRRAPARSTPRRSAVRARRRVPRPCRRTARPGRAGPRASRRDQRNRRRPSPRRAAHRARARARPRSRARTG